MIVHEDFAALEDVDYRGMSDEEASARRLALFLVQQASLIELTGWTFDVLDRQPTDRVAEVLKVLALRNKLELEKMRDAGKGR